MEKGFDCKMKFCPLAKGPCRTDCAWYREVDELCAIATLGYVAVAEYNDYMDEKELQENLHKTVPENFPN